MSGGGVMAWIVVGCFLLAWVGRVRSDCRRAVFLVVLGLHLEVLGLGDVRRETRCSIMKTPAHSRLFISMFQGSAGGEDGPGVR